MAERLAQGDSSGAATSPESSAIKGRRKAGPKRKASKLDLGAPRAGGVEKRKAKAKAKPKRSAGSPASKPKLEPKPEPEEVEICKLEPKPEPEEVEIRKLEWPAEAHLLADTPAPPSPRPAARRGKRSLAPR